MAAAAMQARQRRQRRAIIGKQPTRLAIQDADDAVPTSVLARRSDRPSRSAPPASALQNVLAEAGNDDETEALVSDAVSAEDNNKECQQEGSKGMQSLNADKPDTLAQSYPVVVCTAVVLCFYLGRSFETRLQQIHAH